MSVRDRPAGEWNHYRISFVGNRLAVELNGIEVIDLQAEPRGKVVDFAPRGYIGLQNYDDESTVKFRNIRVKTRDQPNSLSEAPSGH